MAVAEKKSLDDIIDLAETELRRRIDRGEIESPREADEAAAEVAGEVADAYGIEDQSSDEFMAIMSAVLEIAGEEFPGEW